MRNADKPAYPMGKGADGRVWAERDLENAPHILHGLTKRERFAMAAMEGLLANHTIIDNCDDSGLEWIAEKAEKMADFQLAALEQD